MMSAEDISATKVAVELCNNSKLRQILQKRVHGIETTESVWDNNLDKSVFEVLGSVPLANELKCKICDIINNVVRIMLNWTFYHAFNLSISEEICLSFIRSSFFTCGKIDNKKAAEVLLKEGNLSVEQKFKLACLYDLSEIPVWYNRLQKEGTVLTSDDQNPQNFRPTKLYKIWISAMNMNETEKENFLNHNILQESLESGSKEAVAYCLENNMHSRNVSLADIALETIKCMDAQNTASDNDECLMVPDENYLDILYLLLTKMNRNQKIDFLKKDILSIKKGEHEVDSRVLGFLLIWPYQNYFLMIANLMWDFLPESDYVVLLLALLDMAEESPLFTFKYDKSVYDYRKIFTEFWFLSPEHYKRFIFTNHKVRYDGENIKVGEHLFRKLLNFEDNCTFSNEKIFHMILASSTYEEKKNIISPIGWNFCLDLVANEKWLILDEFVPTCFISDEEIKQFKKFFFSSNIDRIKFQFIRLIKDRKEDAVEFLLKWTDLSDDEIRQLKRQMIYSNFGKKTYLKLLLLRVSDAFRFLDWFHLSEDEIRFKRDILFSWQSLDKCESLIYQKSLNKMYDFINNCLSSDEDIREFKKHIFYRRGCSILTNLISRPREYILIGCRKTRNRGNWEEVEKLVTWCFASEEEISNFKKKLLKISGARIHFQLIRSCQFERAETFFAWLGLADEEVKMLKKDTFYNHEEAVKMMVNLLHGEQTADADFGSREEKIALFLRWYLTDVESVMEFQKLKGVFCKKATDDETRSRNTEVMLELYRMAKQLLEDFNFVF